MDPTRASASRRRSQQAASGSSGTIAKIDALTGEFTVKDREGKTYVVQKTDVVAKDLKTWDATE